MNDAIKAIILVRSIARHSAYLHVLTAGARAAHLASGGRELAGHALRARGLQIEMGRD